LYQGDISSSQLDLSSGRQVSESIKIPV
jgi:hypothetical protein